MKGFHETIGFRDDGCYAVVFTAEQAMTALRDGPPSMPVLCIDLPRAELVFCVADAQHFFATGIAKAMIDQLSSANHKTYEQVTAELESASKSSELQRRALPRMQEQGPWRGEPA